MAAVMRDVAMLAGVSRTAVSKVLNEKHHKEVSAESAAKILAAMRKLAYHPHGMGRSLVLRKSHTIGIGLYGLDYIQDNYFATLISGMERVIGRNDYNLQFTTTCEEDRGDEKQNLFFLKKVKAKYLDGLIIIDQLVADDSILKLKEEGVPFVLIDRDISHENVNCILADNRAGTFEAIEHLIRLGHRRIGLIIESEQFYKSSGMLKGYHSALREHDIQYAPDLVRETRGISEKACEKTEELLDLPAPPTAIFMGSDLIVVEAMRAIRDRHLTVPGDLAVVGFTDTPLLRAVVPAITSVAVPLRLMGEMAGEMVMKLVRKEELDTRMAVLKPQLVIRDSCGARIDQAED